MLISLRIKSYVRGRKPSREEISVFLGEYTEALIN
jgi:hypothetical protein